MLITSSTPARPTHSGHADNLPPDHHWHDPDPILVATPLGRWQTIGAVTALCCGSALAIIDSGIVNVALPTIAQDLGVSGSSAVLIVTVYQLMLMMFILPLAALGETIGLRTLYQCGQVMFLVTTVLCFVARDLTVLLIIRAIQGLAAASVLGVSAALTRQIYPPEKLGRGLAVNAVIMGSALALAPTLGGMILAVAHWPWVFGATVPLAFMSLLFGRALPKSPPVDHRYDFMSASLCVATFGLIAGGCEAAAQSGSRRVIASLAVPGIAIGVLYIRRELAAIRPIMPIDMFARPAFAFSAIAAGMAYVASTLLLVTTPFRLEHGLGFSPALVGAAIAFFPGAMIVASPLAGFLSDRYSASRLGLIGMAVGVTGLLFLFWLPAGAHYWNAAWRLAVCGAGFGFFQTPNARLMIEAAPHDRVASASGLASTARLIGQTTGATLAGLLLASGFDNGLSYLVATGFALAAGLCGAVRMGKSAASRAQ